ncbi:MAG: hypothetical protein U9R14_04815 [Patescibacteria group bacterium]|nr:hypothetical protein [Patescibacteria group bacterium]
MIENNFKIDKPKTKEQREVLNYNKRVAKLFETGLNSEDIHGWHGTSIEAILYLAKHGRLPVSGLYEDTLYYAPKESLSIKAQDHASMYANDLAKEYFVLNQLPFEVKNRELFSGIFDHENYDDETRKLVEDDLKKFIAEEVIPNNFDENTFRNLVREANKRKGVIISLSERITQDYEEHGGDDMDLEDMSIQTKKGLPIQYITGIVPLGLTERKELEKIKQQTV